MARLLGPAPDSRLVYGLSGGWLSSGASLTAVAYADEAATTLADIRVYDGTATPGAALAGSSLTVGADSQLPLFWFPDGVDTVWVKANGGAAQPVYADTDRRLDSIVEDIAELVLADSSLTTDLALKADKATLWVNVKDAPYSAVGDGVVDDTAALQAAIDAAGYGGTVYIPRGNYRITTLTLNHSQQLVGSGWHHLRDAVTTFGDVNYSSVTYFQGTILRSTVTSGAAITHAGSGGNNVMEGSIADLTLIGPGSGTSIGIQFGTASVPVVKAVYRNVMVANFATGLALANVNEAGVYDLTVKGCTKAMTWANGVNANTFVNLNMQRCTDGLSMDDATSLANTFVSPICQNVSGTGFVVRGESHVFMTPYFEVVTARTMDFIGASHCRVQSPSVQGAGVKDMRVQSGCFFNEFHGLKTAVGSFTFTNAGYGTVMAGVLSGVADTGSQSWLLDLNNAAAILPKLTTTHTTGPSLQLGASALGMRYGSSGPEFRQGSAAPEGAVVAPPGSVYQRTTAGSGPTFLLKQSGAGNTGWAQPGMPIFNVKDYGAAGNGAGNDGPALQAAIDAANTAGGGTAFLPPGTYAVTSTVNLKAGVRLLGASRTATRIVGNGVTLFSWTATVNQIAVESMRIDATGGHIFSSTFAIYIAAFRDLACYQLSIGFCIFDHQSALDYDKVLVEHCDLSRPAGATVPAWRIINSGGAANENTWRFLRVFSANGTGGGAFFHLENSVNTYAFENRFEDITGEQCPSGVIEARSVRNFYAINVRDWDTQVPYVADVVRVTKATDGSAPLSRNIVVIGCGMILAGGGSANGHFDVNLVPGTVQYGTIIESHNNVLTGKVNFGTGDYVNVIGGNAADGWSGQPSGVANFFGGGIEVAPSRRLIVDSRDVGAMLSQWPTSVVEFAPSRDLWGSRTVAPSSGTLTLTYFTAATTGTVNTLTMWSGSVAAATVTLIRYGVYSVAANGDLTLIASTANDTGLMAVIDTAYAKALQAPWSKVSGTRYALAYLCVATTPATLHGQQLAASNPINLIVRDTVPIAGRVTSQTDLPASVAAGSIVGFQALPAFKMS